MLPNFFVELTGINFILLFLYFMCILTICVDRLFIAQSGTTVVYYVLSIEPCTDRCNWFSIGTAGWRLSY